MTDLKQGTTVRETLLTGNSQLREETLVREVLLTGNAQLRAGMVVRETLMPYSGSASTTQDSYISILW